MVQVRSISNEQTYSISNFHSDSSFLNRLCFLFNYHEFANFLLVQDGNDYRLVRYVTFNQPYSNPLYFSIILRPLHYNFDIVNSMLTTPKISLNQLPYHNSELSKLFNLKTPSNDYKLSETPFSKELVTDDSQCFGLTEASVKCAMKYHSHVVVVEGSTVLIKFRLQSIAHDEIGRQRLDSPLLDPKELLYPKINHHGSRAM